MSRTAEFFFDYGSPTSYLAATQLPLIAERAGATLVYRPMLLGGLFQAVGNQPPGGLELKANWMRADLQRFAKRYGVPLAHNPHFPVNTMMIMRGAVFAQRQGWLTRYSDAVFKGMWVDGLDMADPATVMRVLSEAKLDAAKIAEGTQDQSVKDELRATTEEAAARGAFGAPTVFVGEDMFFGQDRLDFVEEALSA